MMMRTGLKYSAGLIALYLGVYYYTGAGRLIRESANGGSRIIRTFQGR